MESISSVACGDYYAFADPNRTPNEAGEFYWRIRVRGKRGVNVWTGRATETGIRERLSIITGGTMSDIATTSVVSAERKQSLRIGVVSTVEHIKTLQKLLKQKGHVVQPLPELGNKNTVPSTIDVLVCRVQGTSHRATSICFEEARKGTRPVIFRNGTTSTLIEIEKVVNGTWQPDARTLNELEVDTEQEESVNLPDSEPIDYPGETRRLIQTLVEKGGIFSKALTMVANQERARNVLCKVSYAERDRVKRVAVVTAWQSLASRLSWVDEQTDALAAEGQPSFTMYRKQGDVVSSELVLTHEPMTDEQKGQYVSALNAQSKRWEYALTESELTVVKPIEPEAPPVVEAPVAVHVAAVMAATPIPEPPSQVVLPVAEVVAIRDDVKTLPDSVEKEVSDLLELVALHMDTEGVTNVPVRLLEVAGLAIVNGALTLTTTHMLGADGDGVNTVLCTKAGARISDDPTKVTCKRCKADPMYAYASKLHNRWLAAQGK